MKSIIVAYDKNHGIGANNDLLWERNLPSDLQHFKKVTSGHAIIMGYNTYRSIGKPLPNRLNIVISEKPDEFDGFTVVSNLVSAFEVAKVHTESYVVGGGYIYAQAMDIVDRIYATEVNWSFDNATVFFPAIDPSKWREISREHHTKDARNLYDYDFVVYDRISN
ncbi:dihydrofolate reductase [Candidatus Saccharibacteria bacterium]|nr:dihydrofolate reductase [Candidatus Saccharibacteria bacterium]